jgi:hypothetical protein
VDLGDVLLGVGLGWFAAAVLAKDRQPLTVDAVRQSIEDKTDPSVIDVGDDSPTTPPRMPATPAGPTRIPPIVARLVQRLLKAGVKMGRNRIQEGFAYHFAQDPDERPIIAVTPDGVVVDKDAIEERLARMARQFGQRYQP